METRNRIIETAFCLFLDKGFSDVSLNEMIQTASVTKGCFYHYFESKDQLIREVVQSYLCPFFGEPILCMKKRLAEAKTDLSPKEKLQIYYETIHHYVLTENLKNMFKNRDIRTFYFLLYEGVRKYPFLAQISKQAYEQQVLILQQILEEGQKEGIFSEKIDPHEWAETVNTLKNGLFSLKLLNESIDLEQKCKISFQQICNEIIA